MCVGQIDDFAATNTAPLVDCVPGFAMEDEEAVSEPRYTSLSKERIIKAAATFLVREQLRDGVALSVQQESSRTRTFAVVTDPAMCFILF